MLVPLKKTRPNAARGDISLEKRYCSMWVEIRRLFSSRWFALSLNLTKQLEVEALGKARRTVVVKPICSQYAGEFMEYKYKLSTAEFFEAQTLYSDDLNAQLSAL
jgi:hypothetical protein